MIRFSCWLSRMLGVLSALCLVLLASLWLLARQLLPGSRKHLDQGTLLEACTVGRDHIMVSWLLGRELWHFFTLQLTEEEVVNECSGALNVSTQTRTETLPLAVCDNGRPASYLVMKPCQATPHFIKQVNGLATIGRSCIPCRVAIKAMMEAYPHVKVVLYCEAGHSAETLKLKVKQHFGIIVPAHFAVVPLTNTHLLAPELWPYFTLLTQGMGSVAVAWGGLRQMVPEVWVDTVGYAMPYPLVAAAGAKIVAYVHYPTISADMTSRVSTRSTSFNNSSSVSSSSLKSMLKLVYYHLFAMLYGWLGALPHVVMVNSTWTLGHIRSLWWRRWAEPACIVYPPCDVSLLAALPLTKPRETICLCSIAQFRPEKNHRLQLEALRRAREIMKQEGKLQFERIRVYFCGGCRNSGDEARLADLVTLTEALHLQGTVEFCPNATFHKITGILARSVGGLHSMQDEHFGISVVEYMASGCIPIAHDSAGPRQDIVVPAIRSGESAAARDAEAVGFLASDIEGFARCIVEVVEMEEAEALAMAQAGRQRAQQFSVASFQDGWIASVRVLRL